MSRRILAAVAAAAAALAALLGATPASADPTIDPSAVTTIEIHKFEQPATAGTPATGLPQDTTGLVPVPDATFTATRVPGIDLTTNAGQQAAAALTASDAAALVAGLAADATDTTDGAGDATLTPLGVGLYYVRETLTPAGYVPAAPFLVALPLTNPDTRDDWLTTVHVYPKNAHVGIVLDVDDAAAVTLGDTVTWTSRADIPHQTTIDGYRIVQDIAAGLTLDAAGIDVALDCDTATAAVAPAASVAGATGVAGAATAAAAGACPTLLAGTHYTLDVAADGSRITVDFTDAGRQLLASAVADHPGADVAVRYPTTVDADGAYVNTATLLPSRATIDGAAGAAAAVSDTAETRWGPLAILVHEIDHPEHLIPGARFKLYPTPEDAAAGTNPIVVAGVGEWTSNANGRVDIAGLRFSDFVNGLQRDPTDPLYREYYVVLTGVPDGWEGSSGVLPVTVTSTTQAQLVVVELRQSTGGGGGGGGNLAWTGLQVAGAGAAAAALVAAGVLFLIAGRRRRRDEAEAR